MSLYLISVSNLCITKHLCSNLVKSGFQNVSREDPTLFLPRYKLMLPEIQLGHELGLVDSKKHPNLNFLKDFGNSDPLVHLSELLLLYFRNSSFLDFINCFYHSLRVCWLKILLPLF